MTKTESLLKCVVIWMWLAQHTGKSKKQAYKFLCLHMDAHQCPLCGYVNEQNEQNSPCSIVCPLSGKWGDDTDRGCSGPDGYYGMWVYYFDCYHDTWSTILRKYYAWKMKRNALKIVYACEERIEEIKRENNE